MSSKKRKVEDGSTTIYFSVPGAETTYTKSNHQQGTLEWIQNNIHTRYGTECESNDVWIPLPPGSIEHLRAVVVADSYQGLDATGANMNGRLCNVAYEKAACNQAGNCTWCELNKMCLAPMLKGGNGGKSKNQYVYGFVNCDSKYETCRFPPHGEKIIVDVIRDAVTMRVPQERISSRSLLETYVTYYPEVVYGSEKIFSALSETIKFERPRCMFGNIVRRSTAFLHRDGENSISYFFGGQTHVSAAIDDKLKEVMANLFAISDRLTEGRMIANVVLLQHYDDSENGSIAWHSDNESCLDRDKEGRVLDIVGLSFGGPASISFRPAAKPVDGSKRKTKKIKVACGSAYVMKKGTQEHLNHAVLKGDLESPRISATFRRQH